MLLNRLFKAQIKENIQRTRTGEFPAQKASNAENVSIWWRHHERIVISTAGNTRQKKLNWDQGKDMFLQAWESYYTSPVYVYVIMWYYYFWG